jgi:hypothetical protein
MKRTVIAGVLALSSLFAPAAFAQEGKPAKLSDSCAEQRKHDPKKVCTLSIEGSSLEGDHVGPNGEQILAHPPAGFGSLIRERSSMVDKMVKDTDRF